jgi:hypothetical protein
MSNRRYRGTTHAEACRFCDRLGRSANVTMGVAAALATVVYGAVLFVAR